MGIDSIVWLVAALSFRALLALVRAVSVVGVWSRGFIGQVSSAGVDLRRYFSEVRCCG